MDARGPQAAKWFRDCSNIMLCRLTLYRLCSDSCCSPMHTCESSVNVLHGGVTHRVDMSSLVPVGSLPALSLSTQYFRIYEDSKIKSIDKGQTCSDRTYM